MAAATPGKPMAHPGLDLHPSSTAVHNQNPVVASASASASASATASASASASFNEVDPKERLDAAQRRLERVLTIDPGMGVIRDADAGYDTALRVAEQKGERVPHRVW